MIVAIHGFTGHPSLFADLPCASLPLLGHGPDAITDDPVPFHSEVDRLAALLPETPVHLVGYSLGGRLSLALALRHPERVRKLSLISASPGLKSESERFERQQADARWSRLLREVGITAFVDAWEALPLWRSQLGLSEETKARQRQQRLAHDAMQLALALDSLGLGVMPNLWPELSNLRIPVQLIVGSLDDKFYDIAKRMAEQLRKPSLRVIAGSGHNPLLEKPKRVRALLQEEAFA